MRKVSQVWSSIWARFWVVPAVIVSACLISAVLMTEVDKDVSQDFLVRWQRWFGAGADGSRAMLSAVATSIITVASVTFSITMLALSQTSSQYSPRLLRNFMKSRTTQLALGLFLGVFGYCLVVLRTISAGPDYKFVPSISVTAGGVLALVAVGFFVLFIHHIASSLEPSSIMESVFTDTLQAIDALFPQIDKAEEDEEPGDTPPEPATEKQIPITILETGYLISIDADGLLRDAVKHSTCIRAVVPVGAFVVHGQIVGVFNLSEGGRNGAKMAGRFVVRRHRAIEQDPAFGIQQLVDIALRALSPGVNDPTTAVMAIEYLSAILARLASSSVGPRRYYDQSGRARVEIPAPSFVEFTDLCFSGIRSATSNSRVLTKLAEAVGRVGGHAATESRRNSLGRLLEQLTRISAGIPELDDKAALDESIRRARSQMANSGQGMLF